VLVVCVIGILCRANPLPFDFDEPPQLHFDRVEPSQGTITMWWSDGSIALSPPFIRWSQSVNTLSFMATLNYNFYPFIMFLFQYPISKVFGGVYCVREEHEVSDTPVPAKK
jgi:hypothetical protein